MIEGVRDGLDRPITPMLLPYKQYTQIQADKMKQLVSKLANKILCKWLNIHIPKEKHPISINIRGECKYCGKVI